MITVRKMSSAFTLIELTIVIAVIGILASILILGFGGSLTRARDSQRLINVESIAESLEKYYQQNGEYPGCAIMTSSNLNTLSTALYGLNTKVFTMPKYTQNANSIQCTSDIESNNDDIIAYNADTSSSCQTGSGCSYFTLQYREERTGEIKIVKSRRGQVLPEIVNISATDITSTSATLTAKVINTNNSDIINAGICWGTTPKPTTNCEDYEVGKLTQYGTWPAQLGGGTPSPIITTPDGKNIYYVRSTNYIHKYQINLSDGEFYGGVQYTPTVIGQYSMAISENGLYLYIRGSWSIGVYSINPSDGTISLINNYSSSNPGSSNGEYGFSLSSDGKYLYDHNGTSNLLIHKLDTETGNIISSFTVGLGYRPSGMVLTDDGRNIYFTGPTGNIYQYRINSSDGNIVPLLTAFVSTGFSNSGFAVSPDGNYVYFSSMSNSKLLVFSRNSENGELNLAIQKDSFAFGNLYISPDGVSLYADKEMYDNYVYLLSRNKYTGDVVLLTSSRVELSTNTGATNILFLNTNNSVLIDDSGSNTLFKYQRNKMLNSGSKFTLAFTSLPSSTKIYYRSYATNAKGTTYSTDSTFTTL